MLAKEIGLAAVGVAPAIDDVRKTYPWAESAIVAAICYLPPARNTHPQAPAASVARFAQSADYHSVLREKLTILAGAVLQCYPGARLEVCVDTVPLPERKLAVLAGVATRGRNGNVFVDGCGSYAALGEIIIDSKIPPGHPAAAGFEACGDCTRCIESCPTAAITTAGEVNASLCVSQLTQMCGTIPCSLRPAFNDRIYGCDTCQEVCPRNTGIEPRAVEFAAEVFPGPHPDLLPLLRLSSPEFAHTVRPSSIGWIRRTRIRRNAAIVAGNLKSVEALPSLIKMLTDENPLLRAHAAWAISRIPSPQTDATLQRALETEQDPSVIKEITDALTNK